MPRIAGPVLLERPRVQEDTTARSRPRSRWPRAPGRTACSGTAACAAGPRRARRRRRASTRRGGGMPNDDRQEEQRQHRQHARRGADQPADDDAPGAARQLVDHAERQAAERRRRARTCRPSGTTGRTASGCMNSPTQRHAAPGGAGDAATAAGSCASSGISWSAGLPQRHGCLSLAAAPRQPARGSSSCRARPRARRRPCACALSCSARM